MNVPDIRLRSPRDPIYPFFEQWYERGFRLPSQRYRLLRAGSAAGIRSVIDPSADPGPLRARMAPFFRKMTVFFQKPTGFRVQICNFTPEDNDRIWQSWDGGKEASNDSGKWRGFFMLLRDTATIPVEMELSRRQGHSARLPAPVSAGRRHEGCGGQAIGASSVAL
jgi:hypothetical protein